MFGQNLRLGSPWPRGDNPWLGIRLRLRFCRRRKEATELLGLHASQGADGEEAEQQRILDAMDSPEWAKIVASKDVKPQGEEAEQRDAE